jgi:N-acyl amino acid synthase of PEP-CTERM/exosortase system
MKNFGELIAPFQNYFQILIADTPELMEQVHRVRYEVFCQEFHFEQEENCPGGLERDEYDDQAIHFLIMHRNSALPAGCVRLIQTRTTDPDAPLPIERYCAASLAPGEGHPSRMLRNSLCEISRLAVSGHFRKRRGESESPLGTSEGIPMDNEIEYRIFPLLSFTLFLAVLSMSIFTQQRDSLAMMEPWLARHLQLMGFSFRQIGELTDYHGARAAFHYTLDQALADKERRPILRQLFDLIDPLIEAEARRTGLSRQ